MSRPTKTCGNAAALLVATLIAPVSGGMARQGELMRVGAHLAIDEG